MVNKPATDNISILDSNNEFDVCIIGSGPAGTILGASLASKGVKTLILESGAGLLKWFLDSRLENLADYEFSGDTAYPMKKTKARVIGGNSNFWTGRCERLHPSDFDSHPYTPGDNSWPITYEELDPYYEKAEKSLRVRGGKRAESAPPRKNPLPLPPKPDISYLKSLFSRAGVVADDSPTATPTKTLRFFRVQKEILPEALSSAFGSLISGATITRLIPDTERKIVGAEVRTLDGGKKIACAKYFVVACGGIETPRLLLLSKSEKFPNGIGNSYDRVGRGFNEHPGINFYAKIRHELGTIQPTNKIARTHQFYSTYRAEGLGSVLPVFRQSWVLPHHMYPFKISNIPKNIMSILKRFIKPTLFIGATIEQKISNSNRVALSESQEDYFGNPVAHLIFTYSEEDLVLLDRCRELTLDIYNKLGAKEIYEAEVTWSRHHQGTTRMGNNPQTSVVDRNLRVHDCSNLFLCGAETFVTGGAMQPVLTIAALSHRLADHLLMRLKQD
jgi:choline dehydrogenase-like flavoprotein